MYNDHVMMYIYSSSEESLVRSYGRSFNGFAAKLTDKEREKLASMYIAASMFMNQDKIIYFGCQVGFQKEKIVTRKMNFFFLYLIV